jgi:predicted component of type VI protein secretion system
LQLWMTQARENLDGAAGQCRGVALLRPYATFDLRQRFLR